jgi:RNA polymerase sigma-70 factor (ECF subfamily)
MSQKTGALVLNPLAAATFVEDEANRRLVRRVAQGDQAAFQELYLRFSPAIYNYLTHLTLDAHEAEDLLQETFMGLWKGAAGFRGGSQVKTWLFQIAHNQAVSWLRRNRSLPVSADEVRLVEEQLDPEHAAIQAWRNEQVQAALRRLSPEHRAVVDLAFFHELPYQQIAEVLNCPVGTVKSRLSYARRYLSGILRGQNGIQEHAA